MVYKKPNSAKDLSEIARRLLRAADVGDRLPTPQNEIIECSKLVQGGVIDLNDFKESFLNKMGRVFFDGWKMVKGALAVRDNTIFINADVPDSQRPFLIFHEVAHGVIPWQREAYDMFADDYYCLLPSTEAVFDSEANHLSGLLLFQCNRLKNEAKDYRFGIATGIKLAQDYGASYHSTLWHYVETRDMECTLLVLKKAKYAVLIEGVLTLPYILLYSVASTPFHLEFGEIQWPKHFSDDHAFLSIVNDPAADSIEEGEFWIFNKRGEKVNMKYEAWTNSYNIFVLIWKKRRLILPKTRVKIK